MGVVDGWVRVIATSLAVFTSVLGLAEFPPSALGAVAPGVNVIANPQAESGSTGLNPEGDPAPADWTTTGDFTTLQYGPSGGFPTTAVGASVNGGTDFFAGATASTYRLGTLDEGTTRTKSHSLLEINRIDAALVTCERMLEECARLGLPEARFTEVRRTLQCMTFEQPSSDLSGRVRVITKRH